MTNINNIYTIHSVLFFYIRNSLNQELSINVYTSFISIMKAICFLSVQNSLRFIVNTFLYNILYMILKKKKNAYVYGQGIDRVKI